MGIIRLVGKILFSFLFQLYTHICIFNDNINKFTSAFNYFPFHCIINMLFTWFKVDHFQICLCNCDTQTIGCNTGIPASILVGYIRNFIYFGILAGVAALFKRFLMLITNIPLYTMQITKAMKIDEMRA